MNSTQTTATLQKIIGAALVVFGALVVTRWIFQLDWIARAFPGSAQMGINTPTLLLATGICCLLLPQPARGHRHRLALACIALTIVLSAMTLAQHLFGISLGIDFVRVPTPPTPANPHPGRMAPNTAAAFLLAGFAFLLMQGGRPRQRWLLTVLLCLVALLSLGGLVGYVLRLETLYRVASFNRMVLPTAMALSTLSLALWLMSDRLSQEDPRAERQLARITVRSVVVLLMVAVAAGVAGFGLLRDSYDRAVLDGLRLTAKTNTAAISHAIEQSLWFPRTIVTRPAVRETLATIDGAPDAAAPREFLQKVAASFLTAGLHAVEMRSASGGLLVTAGTLTGDETLLREPLAVEGLEASLLWNDGYVIETRSDVLHEGRRVGQVRMQQRLAIVDRLLADIRGASASHDALLCSRAGDEAVCAPTRFYRERFRIPMFNAAGLINLPINRALAGESGVRVTKDLRGIEVAAAYTPVVAGLAIVVKADLDTLYAPIREQMLTLALALVTLVVAGTYALRLRVGPLIARIDLERERTRVILDNSNDAFIALGVDGCVTDWNRQSEATFGWAAAEAIGKPLSQLIIPPPQRQAHDEGLRRFAQTGTGPVIDKRLELTAVDRSGREFLIEMSIAAYNHGAGYVSNAFVRDISDRKAAERALEKSERQLRAIADNLPVMISYIDRRERVTFLNKTFTEWTGVDHQTAVGGTLLELIGADLYEQRRAQLARSLSGERVAFEMESTVIGVHRHLRAEYIPDIQADGAVAGVFTLTTDVTLMKEVELQLRETARVDSLTGLDNRQALNEKVLGALNRAARSNLSLALLFLDIDRFKTINDSFGHATGDAVLREFAVRLKDSVRLTDTVARLAGDEFVILLEGLHSREEPQAVARKILAKIGQPFVLDDGRSPAVSTSIGIALHAAGPVSPADLMAAADAALYRAKAAGRNTYVMAAP